MASLKVPAFFKFLFTGNITDKNRKFLSTGLHFYRVHFSKICIIFKRLLSDIFLNISCPISD